ncbi:restriction endonuclease subunit S [Moraxella catarrhalis]|uniref:Type I restriction modification DNA specificity domain protein n=1 Tax=Moraxella catarrhalis TaxID=480 RepID=A0A3S9QHL4_MORCA|nr:restriction endonuclease subunit S [Moraxella catarrhalis]AZQ94168.1 type I restriction modification DNA specificity domain protein [Moraxella catarrhalis]AZQ95108.1 type I restriction modification DNA specificity domain protein [Moraxella catarrhalis]MPW66965.1 restriction endonuclease subunit S [Moraxella catarrhalis]MPX55580.1 restriction endonuclease subunit S [Moraxella catarrhalis]RKL79455.1 restriction endonuclease subunit S [Moraxella catarrhalis]
MSDTQTRLDEIAELNPTRALKKGKMTSFVEMASLPTNSRDIENIAQKEFSGSGSKFKNGDILFARITPCLENGKTAKVAGLQHDEIAHGSTEFIVLSAREPEFDEDYLYYFCRLSKFRNYAKSRMEGTSGRQRVSWQALAEFEFDFPDKEIRKKAADMLKIFDDKIQLNTQTNQTLEAIAQAIFKSWFVDFDPVRAKAAALSEGKSEYEANLAAMSVICGKDTSELNDTEYKALWQIAEAFPSELVENIEFGEVPKGWEVKSLDNIANYQNGLALQKFRPENNETFLPVVKIAQLRQGYADGEEKASADIKSECIIDNGDIIFSWSGTLMVDIWCGGKAALNQHLFKVTSNHYPKWFYYLWTKYHLAEFQRIAADKAVTMGHIKREHLSQALCIVPHTNFLQLVPSIEGFIEKIILNRLENFKLAQTRDLLLPKLLSGELLNE